MLKHIFFYIILNMLALAPSTLHNGQAHHIACLEFFGVYTLVSLDNTHFGYYHTHYEH